LGKESRKISLVDLTISELRVFPSVLLYFFSKVFCTGRSLWRPEWSGCWLKWVFYQNWKEQRFS